eukprot:TRINITY_DN72219_c0_g1_i1.p1 TRINITY_DN72219_c0_g1~~TRINITY_DN72219_c0_g1_i1.p1  ORF type:complete len:227 (-),score=51.01 TRINITY_DN72219_c0_g1_i1:134-814(-)
MQLEGLSQLHKNRPPDKVPVYYTPASQYKLPEKPPPFTRTITLLPRPRAEDASSLHGAGGGGRAGEEGREASSRRQLRTAKTAEALQEPSSPVLSGVLEKRRQEIREQWDTSRDLQRRHSWHEGMAADLEVRESEDDVSGCTAQLPRLSAAQRVAALLLPGLKRERMNAPLEDRSRISAEIEALQGRLGLPEDVPRPNIFLVSRREDRHEGEGSSSSPLLRRMKSS